MESISRATETWPKIELIDDREGNQFKAVVWRPEAEKVGAAVAVEVSNQTSRQVPGKSPGKSPGKLSDFCL